jgi:hypothetical protein
MRKKISDTINDITEPSNNVSNPTYGNQIANERYPSMSNMAWRNKSKQKPP